MLDRSSHVARLREAIALIAANVGPGHGGAEIGVFTGAFHGSAPAGIAADVDHRGVKPANARCGRLFGSHVGELNDEFRIEARGQAQGHWIDGAKTVNDIRAEEQRDVQTALVHGKMLISVGALRADGVEHRAKPASCSQLHSIHMIDGLRIYSRNRALLALGRRRGRGIAGIVVLNELSNLFVEGHLVEQAIHAGLDVRIGKLGVRWMHGFARMVRRSLFGGLCHCIRLASSRDHAENGTGKNGAEAGVRPETCVGRIHETSGMATLRIHSRHKFSPKHNLGTARSLPAGIEWQERDHGTHAAHRASGLLDGMGQVACRRLRNRLRSIILSSFAIKNGQMRTAHALCRSSQSCRSMHCLRRDS